MRRFTIATDKFIQPSISKDTVRIYIQLFAERDRCEGKNGSVHEEKKPQKQIAPQLYDLTTLQREAPFTAKNTLSLAQALYERHKMITYPRTDSRYLPEDSLSHVKEATRDIAGSNLARIYLQKREVRRAVILCRQVVELDPGNAQARELIRQFG